MEGPGWTEEEFPAGLDPEHPSAARVYDYLLGGSNNFAVDRQLARALVAAVPDAPMRARIGRAFLHRCVGWLARAGIAQYLDIGAGIPAAGTVHGIARAEGVAARVVYADVDPVAVHQARAVAAGDPHVAVLHADLREPEHILAHPALRAVLDLRTPVALLLAEVLPAVPDDQDAYGLVRRLCAALEELFAATGAAVTLRSRAQVRGFFSGLEMVQPGLVWAPQWHPHSRRDVGRHPERSGTLVGVARTG